MKLVYFVHKVISAFSLLSRKMKITTVHNMNHLFCVQRTKECELFSTCRGHNANAFVFSVDKRLLRCVARFRTRLMHLVAHNAFCI